jgi:hypothetical protein
VFGKVGRDFRDFIWILRMRVQKFTTPFFPKTLSSFFTNVALKKSKRAPKRPDDLAATPVGDGAAAAIRCAAAGVLLNVCVHDGFI